MKPVFIHSAVCISAQQSFDEQKMMPLTISEEKVKAIQPDYGDFMAPGAARRMSPVVKMGVVTAKKALQLAKVTNPDAIITGSGMGCMQDTEKFLNTLLENQEQYLTPTAFIQSTHNTVGGQIALALACKAYNITYVHGSLSFESALVDAQMLLQENSAKHILVGGFDELGTEFIDYVAQQEKRNEQPMQVPYGEGAGFFILSSQKSDNGIKLKGMTTVANASENEVVKNLSSFLSQHQCAMADIDVLLLGNTGDAYDAYYEVVADQFSAAIEQISFKQYSGEFYTAVTFAMWWGFQLLAQTAGAPSNSAKQSSNVLIYNHEKGANHSFILLGQ